MKIYVLNPHIEDLLAVRVSNLITRRRATIKYDHFIHPPPDYRATALFWIDPSASSLVGPNVWRRFPALLRWLWTFAEGLIWALINKVPLSKLRFRGFIRPRPEDAVIIWLRKLPLTHPGADAEINRFSTILAHLAHCNHRVPEMARRLAPFADKVEFVCEIDMPRRSAFFRAMFAWHKRPGIVSLFVPARRFEQRKAFAARQNRLVSTGSFHDFKKDPEGPLWNEVAAVTGLNNMHPIREELSRRRSEVVDLIEVRNSRFWESAATLAAAAAKARERSLLQPLRRARALLTKLLIQNQKAYFAFDIVELYNDFRFALIGEESIGPPGIGAAESMACGCALIGRNDGVYDDWGMREGEHYIGYDGGFDSLIATLQAARAAPAKAEKIAAQGQALVAQAFTAQAVWARLLADIAQVRAKQGAVA